jgi:glutamyl-tRNA reductase
MQPALVVIGLNHRTASLDVRERFWMSAERRTEALATLSQAEGIEEVFVFSTCQRTEFVVWGDPTLAINSVLRFLAAKYDLKLSEWNGFYRLLDESALVHVFRVSCGLDSMSIGEGRIARQVSAAWQQTRASGSTGRYLDAVLRKVLSVRRRVLKQTAVEGRLISAPHAAVELAREVFESLAKRNIVVLGAGTMGEISAQTLVDRGADSVCVISRNGARTAELASRIGIDSAPFQERRRSMAAADLVISAVSGFLFSVDEIEEIAPTRGGRTLVLIDLGVPRSVDPAARNIPGVVLYDLDDLERAVKPPAATPESEVEAQRIILEEVKAFSEERAALDKAPAVCALRQRLDEICRQELEHFRIERGPFPKDQDGLLTAVSVRITHRIAGSLARDLKAVPQAAGIKAAV